MKTADDLKPDDFGDKGWFSEDGMPWHRAKAQYLALIERVSALKSEQAQQNAQAADLVVRLYESELKLRNANDISRFWMTSFFVAVALFIAVSAWGL